MHSEIEGKMTLVNFHFQMPPRLDWSIEKTTGIKLLKQCSREETTLTHRPEEDNFRSNSLPKLLDLIWRSLIMFYWLPELLHINKMFFYYGHDLMLVLKADPVFEFVGNYLCLVLLDYFGGFLHSKALI